MGRRSDHSRAELRDLILEAGETLMAESGLSGFSAREVAKRVGYTIGTIHNVFGNVDGLMAQPDVDGALVGGASLKAEEFARIARFQAS